MKRPAPAFWLLLLVATACSRESDQSLTAPETFVWEIPEGFPVPKLPDDNPLTAEKVELGRMLFFDPILSRDFSISCGSCHHPGDAFSDTVAFSIGAEGKVGERNAPSLMNVAYKPHLFKEGGISTLEIQILAPFDNHLEFDLNVVVAVERLKEHPFYREEFQRVFGKEPDFFGLTRSIAAFERTLFSGDSRWDRHERLGEQALTESELRGYALFKSERLQCTSCHSGIFFTDHSFQNNGLKEQYADSGRARITMSTHDAGKFVVPTLRNVALTAPYMHDGSLSTLEEVVAHYESGGSSHHAKSTLIRGFSLSDMEREDLIHFLESLTDERYLTATD